MRRKPMRFHMPTWDLASSPRYRWRRNLAGELVHVPVGTLMEPVRTSLLNEISAHLYPLLFVDREDSE